MGVAKILVIDDEKLSRRILEKHLHDCGETDVTSFDNGSEGVLEYLGGSYDLTFLDIMMPDVSGMDVLKIVDQLRARGRVSGPANIVVATALTDKSELDTMAAFESVYTVLRKPLKPDSIRWLLEGFHMLKSHGVC